jgi:diphthine-ammonia ligase
MEKVFVSWSGGKDCCLACYRAIKSGYQVQALVNMVTENGEKSWSHQIPARWLKMQAEAMGIPIVQEPTSSENYKTNFKKVLASLKQEGVTAGIFGDIDFNEHRAWVESVCQESGLQARLPLWLEKQETLIREFVDSGFSATVVLTKAAILGQEWVGRTIDSRFIQEILELGKTIGLTPCGEAGEYHSLVTDGPLFKKRVEITGTTRLIEQGYWSLEISQLKLRPKKVS